MSVSKKTQNYFDASAGSNFQTPTNKFTTNNWIKPDNADPFLAYFSAKGFPVEEKRIYAQATQGEFDVAPPTPATQRCSSQNQAHSRAHV